MRASPGGRPSTRSRRSHRSCSPTRARSSCRSSRRRSSSRSSPCRSSRATATSSASISTPHRGAARVHAADEVEVLTLQRLARRRRDRERAPLRGDAPACRRARASDAARGDARARPERWTSSCPRSRRRRAELLRADSCHVYLLDPGSEELRLRASAPRGAEAPNADQARRARAGARPERPLGRGGGPARRRRRAARPARRAKGTSEVELARAAANQTAVAIKKIELIERLDGEEPDQGLLRAARRRRPCSATLEGRAARLGCDLDRPLSRARRGSRRRRAREGARGGRPGSLFDRRDDSVRGAPARPVRRGGITRREASGDPRGARGARLDRRLEVCQGAASFRAGFEEAQHALARRLGDPRQARRHDLRGARAVQVPPAHADRLGPSATAIATRSRASPSTTASARRHFCERSKNSSAGKATSARRPRRSTSTRTPFASVSGASRSCQASTCARTTGSSSRSP